MFRSLFRSPDAAETPAAPAAPAAPVASPLQAAVDAARGRAADGQPLVTPAAGDPAAPTHHSALQPRTERGEFNGPPQGGDPAAPAPTPETPAAEAAEAAPAAGDSVADALDGSAPPAPAGEEGGGAITVAIPGRAPEDPDFEITVDSRETAERLAQLRNAAMRGEQARAALAQAAAVERQAEEMREAIAVDPAGFILSHLQQGDDVRNVLLTLLTDPAVMTAELREQVTTLISDEREARTVAAEIKAERSSRRDQIRESLAFQREVRQNRDQILDVIASCVPPTLSGEQRTVFINDARREVATIARRNNLRLVNPADVPLMLRGRIAAFGGDPETVAAAIAARTGRGRRGGPSDGPTDRARAPEAVRPTAAQFVQAAAAKKAGAVTTPAGAGVPPARGGAPPKGQTIAERAEWYRRNVMAGGSAPPA